MKGRKCLVFSILNLKATFNHSLKIQLCNLVIYRDRDFTYVHMELALYIYNIFTSKNNQYTAVIAMHAGHVYGWCHPLEPKAYIRSIISVTGPGQIHGLIPRHR
jgi:hypothetical protein